MHKDVLAKIEYLFYNYSMNALDTLVELSSQMELEHAEEKRGLDTGFAHSTTEMDINHDRL